MHKLINNTTHEVISLAEFNSYHRLATLDNVDLSQYGYSLIEDTPKPASNMTEVVIDGQPTLVNGVWTTTWEVVDATTSMTAEELEVFYNKVLTIRKADLAAYRYELETSNLTINGMTVLGDRESRNTLLSAMTVMDAGFITEIDWKMASGWVTISAQVVSLLSNVMCNYVKNCFTKERFHYEAMVAITNVQDLANYNFTTDWPSTTYNF